jgi:hypothetical protein
MAPTGRMVASTLFVIAAAGWTSPARAEDSGAPTDDRRSQAGAAPNGSTNIFTIPDDPALVVRVDNVARVRSDDLDVAKGRAAAPFAKIGAHVVWIDAETAIRNHLSPPFTLVLVQFETTPRGERMFMDALGSADPQVQRAHVFLDPIEALDIGSPRTLASILGDVMAHELGHLLLPPPGHSWGGIMRPRLNMNLWAEETFTRAQAREILARLRRPPIADVNRR